MLEIVTGPAEDDVLKLVSVDQLKKQKRVTANRENDLIKDCILDAWSYLDGPDGRCRRAVLPQTWAFTTGSFPPSLAWRLPVHGARVVTKITTMGPGGGAPVDMPSAAYVSTRRNLIDAYVSISRDLVLPPLATREDAIRVEFEAGWPSAEALPRVYRRALMLLAAHYYDNREETRFESRITQVSRRIELGVDKLLEKQIVPLDYGGGLC